MKGTYLLVLHCAIRLADLQIGKLGQYSFEPGWYLYIGSAYGSGGLPARLAYHARRTKHHPHWHIDYVRAHTTLVETWSVGGARIEKEWTRSLIAQHGISVPVRRFGASDTRTQAQLLYTSQRPSARLLSDSLLEALGMLTEVTVDICMYEEE